MAGINSLAATNYAWLFNNQSKKQDSVSKLWNSYGNFQSNANESLAGLTEVNTNVKSVLSAYEEAKTAFQGELSETMSELGDSAAKIKDFNFKIDSEGAITQKTATDEDGNVTTTTIYSEDLQNALDTVKNFVDSYNGAIKFFSDNSSVSKRVEMMKNTFGDTTYRANLYESIGIDVKSDGSLEISESKLANTILNDPNKISSILGKNGLAGKAESHISFAASQSDKFFPSADEMLGDQLKTAAIYTGKAYQNMAAYGNMGNLLNMMF